MQVKNVHTKAKYIIASNLFYKSQVIGKTSSIDGTRCVCCRKILSDK